MLLRMKRWLRNRGAVFLSEDCLTDRVVLKVFSLKHHPCMLKKGCFDSNPRLFLKDRYLLPSMLPSVPPPPQAGNVQGRRSTETSRSDHR